MSERPSRKAAFGSFFHQKNEFIHRIFVLAAVEKSLLISTIRDCFCKRFSCSVTILPKGFAPNRGFMFTAFKDIRDTLNARVGQTVSASGRLLIVDADRAFLATDYADYRRGDRIPVYDNRIIAKHLLRTLPAYGGGDAIYDEIAFMTGTIVVRDNGYGIGDLTYCKIIRDDLEIIVPLRLGGTPSRQE
jgi:hypothetical protein